MPPPLESLDWSSISARRKQKNLQFSQIPKYEDNPIDWNAAWEKCAGVESEFMIGISIDDSAIGCLGDASELMLSMYQMHYGLLCALQHELSARCLYFFATGFEAKWLAATQRASGAITSWKVISASPLKIKLPMSGGTVVILVLHRLKRMAEKDS
ncbi:hypothetical protein Hypma_003908 [Hypsizygus marmoreus]|uniref:Uncharacterized protein n=1 Tax=Hypsizygus marmoreus TaxID=39966 RepID=A0A369K0S2_HYPMA|nr:hypothetical protein Hypma_003908 [Hypsizygus marmoreus]